MLERIVNGRLNKQIADDLGISIKTVEAHRASIMDKTASGTVADLMRVVVKSELYPKISSTLAEAVAALPSRLAETGLPHTEEHVEHLRRLDHELRESEAERERREAEAAVTGINSSMNGSSNSLTKTYLLNACSDSPAAGVFLFKDYDYSQGWRRTMQNAGDNAFGIDSAYLREPEVKRFRYIFKEVSHDGTHH